MPRVKIYSLFPDQTYRTSKGKTRVELPNYIFTKLAAPFGLAKQQAHSLLQEPVFPENKPIKIDTWAEFTQTPAPMPDMRTAKRIMATPANHLYPISYYDPYGFEEQHKQGEARDEEARQLASARAASAAAGVGMTHLVMVFLGLAVVVLCAIMGLIAADAAGWLSPEDKPAVVEETTSWYLSPYPDHSDA